MPPNGRPLATLVMLLCATTARAQTRANVHPEPPPVLRAAPRTTPITIDGRLDDPAWASATPITEFRQSFPNEGAAPSERTELRVLFDDAALYVGARMYDSRGAAGVRAKLARRDQLLDSEALTSDKIAIALDPYHNHNDRYWFEVNPYGVRGEHANGDASFDPIWEAAGHVDSLGWTAEMRIPYSQLRFSRDTAQTWGMQVWRTIDRLNEQHMWAFWRANEGGGPPRFGHLTGLSIRHRPRQLELLPYVVSRAQYKYADPQDPFHSTAEHRQRVGADARYLLTSNLTLDATVNPDFGQVEVDPAVVNLTAFETFFDEKRPFFVANRGAFSFDNFWCFFCDNASSLGLFYSRRIGREPQLNGHLADNSQFADLPENTRILGAAKITGRTAQGFSVGLLDALTNRESARYVNATNAPMQRQEVEPLSNYFVGRVRKDFRGGATQVGGILTSVQRRLDDTLFVKRLRSGAQALGFDLEHWWSRRTYHVLAQVAFSSVAGSDSAMRRTQETSAHYFQRPDRSVTSDGLFDVRYDPARRSLRGYGLYTRIAKDNGRWLWEAAQNWRSPGFEVNDLAFLSRADYKWMLVNVARSYSTPVWVYQNVFIAAGAQRQYNFDGDITHQELHGGVFGQLRNFWGLRVFDIYHPPYLDDRQTRGGPMVKVTGYHIGNVGINTDSRKPTVFGADFMYGDRIGGTGTFIRSRPSVAIKPAANVYVTFSPSIEVSDDPQQYVTSVTDPTATDFFGTRYVFARLKSTTVSLDTRFNVTFTPDLTLEVFAQPYFSSGAYSEFREYARPRTLDKVIYGRDAGTIGYAPSTSTYTVDPDAAGPAPSFTFDNPDFSFRSLRGNAVVRWEYRPGSTVFVVWTQERSGSDAYGDFDFGRARRGLLRDRPTNVFLVKVNYWVSR